MGQQAAFDVTSSEAQVTRTRRLHDLEQSDAAMAGHKAANLGALARQ